MQEQCAFTADPVDGILAQFFGLHHSTTVVFLTPALSHLIFSVVLWVINDALWKRGNTILSFSSTILSRLTVLSSCSSGIHQGQPLLLLCYFIIDESQRKALWWHSTFCTFSYTDGRVTAYFCCNLGAGMKCQLCDTNIPHCAPACRSRKHPADSDLIKMHWREQLYDFQAKW